jgi:polyisoprenoid-binding protein YceI
MVTSGSGRGLLSVAMMLTAVVALAADNSIDAGHSSVTATFRQENVPVDAPFRRFSGTISYDPAHVAAATAALEVDTASFDLGDETYSAEARKPAWFDSVAYPKASFRSTSARATGAGQFQAIGALTIKGRVQTVTVPISVVRNAQGTVYTGSFVISRVAYGIGDPTWNDVLDDKVTVHFSLVSASH